MARKINVFNNDLSYTNIIKLIYQNPIIKTKQNKYNIKAINSR